MILHCNNKTASGLLCGSLLACLAGGRGVSGGRCGSAIAIMQRAGLSDATFNHSGNKEAVKLVLSNGSNCAGLQTGKDKGQGIAVADHQNVSATGAGIEQRLDQLVGVLGGNNGGRDLELFGQRSGRFLGALGVSDKDLLDA